MFSGEQRRLHHCGDPDCPEDHGEEDYYLFREFWKRLWGRFDPSAPDAGGNGEDEVDSEN